MGLFSKLREAQKLAALLADVNRGAKDLPAFVGMPQFLSGTTAPAQGYTAASTLDLGCGPEPRNPFEAQSVHGIDIRADGARGIRDADLAVEPIPHPDARFEFVTAFDFLEHVPRVLYLPQRRFPFVVLMNEIWRVLKPGGYFLSSTPMVPFPWAFGDPTHVNPVAYDTFSTYFDDRNRGAAMYGFHGSFQIVRQARRDAWLVCLMRKAG
jgi:SAM-dependent methyltransferase